VHKLHKQHTVHAYAAPHYARPSLHPPPNDTNVRCLALQADKNATSLANRFKDLGGLKLLLAQELSAINKHQADCVGTLKELQGAVGGGEGPDELLIEQAGQCGRCRCVCGRLWEQGIWRLSGRGCKLQHTGFLVYFVNEGEGIDSCLVCTHAQASRCVVKYKCVARKICLVPIPALSLRHQYCMRRPMCCCVQVGSSWPCVSALQAGGGYAYLGGPTVPALYQGTQSWHAGAPHARFPTISHAHEVQHEMHCFRQDITCCT
jgi:hypothetical protein